MQHSVVSQDQWVAARKALLAKEKEFTQVRDQLSAARRELPWVKIDKAYAFDGPAGRENLADLFGGRSQLIVYHFMLGPGWEEGCPSCSYLADHFDGAVIHLAQRDVALVAVSRAPLAEIEAYKQRMGWRFKWVSSFGSDFNRDFHVSFTPEEKASGRVEYNYAMASFPSEEAPGLSAFAKNDTGESSTPTRPMRAAWISWSAPTISSTSRRRAATSARGRWPGFLNHGRGDSAVIDQRRHMCRKLRRAFIGAELKKPTLGQDKCRPTQTCSDGADLIACIPYIVDRDGVLPAELTRHRSPGHAGASVPMGDF